MRPPAAPLLAVLSAWPCLLFGVATASATESTGQDVSGSDQQASSPAAVPAVRPPAPRVQLPAAFQRIAVDGVLDEPSWGTAARIAGFQRYEPVEGGPTTGQVEVLMSAGPAALHVAFVITDDPALVRAHVSARESDGTFADDLMSILIDPWLDGRRLLEFGVTPLGIQFDARITDDGFDISFDAAWDSAGRLTDTGYVVELAIPWSSLRFPRAAEQRWGITFERRVKRNDEQMVWPERHAAWGGKTRQTAVLEGFAVPGRRTRVELWPSLVLGYGADAGDDGVGGLEFERPAWWEVVQPSLGVRWLATRNFVVDLTLNPDYSQVESDPFQVDANLRYPVQLQERRPFFQEGAEFFETGTGLIYTRTLSEPLFGLKVTGKEGRVGVGLLEVMDLAPSASFFTMDTEKPAAGYGDSGTALCPTPGFCEEDLAGKVGLTHVANLSVDVGPGSVVGVGYSEKDLVDVSGSFLDPRLGVPGGEAAAQATREATATNRVVAGYTNLKLGTRGWLSAKAGGGFTRSDDVSLDGYGGGVDAGFRSRHLALAGGVFAESPELRLENAWYASGNRTGAWGEVGARAEPGLEALRSVSPSGGGWFNVDFSGRLTEVGAEAAIDYEGARNTEGGFEYTFLRQRYAGVDFLRHVGSGWTSSHPVSWLSISVDANGGNEIYYDATDPFLGVEVGGSVSLTFRPTAAVAITPQFREGAFYRPDTGEWLYHEEVVRVREEVAFTRRWSLRAIQEWDSYDKLARASLLVTWLRWPGTAVYLGASASAGYATGRLELQDLQFFLKGSYVLRL